MNAQKRKTAKFICKHCGVEFVRVAYSKPKFCSRACAGKGWDHSGAIAAMHLKLREIDPNYGTAKLPRVCKKCGKLFVQKYRHNPLYCSYKCLPQAKIGDKMRERYKTSPKTKRLSETRHNAKRWHLRSPANVEYHPINLNRFVAMHSEMFDPVDLAATYKDGHCRVTQSLRQLRPSNRKKKQMTSWKGWTWVSVYERRFNDGLDLLQRKATP